MGFKSTQLFVWIIGIYNVLAVHTNIKIFFLKFYKTNNLFVQIYDGARNAFLPDAEKTELLNKLNSVYNPVVPESKDF